MARHWLKVAGLPLNSTTSSLAATTSQKNTLLLVWTLIGQKLEKQFAMHQHQETMHHYQEKQLKDKRMPLTCVCVLVVVFVCMCGVHSVRVWYERSVGVVCGVVWCSCVVRGVCWRVLVCWCAADQQCTMFRKHSWCVAVSCAQSTTAIHGESTLHCWIREERGTGFG